MNAFILAAGFGKRMKEYTQNLPKPMLKVQGIRLLDYSLTLLYHWKIKKGIINTHYCGEVIAEHIPKFNGFPIEISNEKFILGTGGGIFTALQRFPLYKQEEFIVINPDTILLPDEDNFQPNSLPSGSLSHLFLLPKPEGASYTPLYFKDNLLSFEPIPGGIPCYYIGLSIIHPSAFANGKKNADENFELVEIWKELASRKQLTGEIFPGRALDVGEKEFYEELNRQEVVLFPKNLVQMHDQLFGKSQNQ